MDHRDDLNLFGSFAPRGARFDARRMAISFTIETAVPVSREAHAEAARLRAVAVQAERVVQAAWRKHVDAACADPRGFDSAARAAAEDATAGLSAELFAAREAAEAADEALDRRVEVQHTLPCRMAVCADCGGRGSYANPGIDAHGISSEEWSDWDDEDREHYLSGGYVTCEGCRGQRVVPVPVEADGCSSAAHKSAWAAYTEWADEEADYRAERAAEIRMGY